MNTLVFIIARMERIFLLGAAAFALGLPLGARAAQLPSTPAGKVLAGYLEALNSGNKEKIAAFVKVHRPDRPDALDRMLDLRWNTGGLVFIRSKPQRR